MGEGGQHHAPATLPPGKTRYPLYRRLGGPQGRSGRVRKISPPPEFDPRTIQPVASHYTDWAIPAADYVAVNINSFFFSLNSLYIHGYWLANCSYFEGKSFNFDWVVSYTNYAISQFSSFCFGENQGNNVKPATVISLHVLFYSCFMITSILIGSGSPLVERARLEPLRIKQ